MHSVRMQIPNQYNRQWRIDAGLLFFPVAAAYGAMAVPLSVLAMTRSGWPSGLVGMAHGREMFFGFAMALVAGYLLGPLRPWRLYGFLAIWLVGRIAGIFFPGTLIAFCIGPLFALAVGALVIPRFRKARKWRNRAVMPILAGICLLPLMWRMNVTLPFAEMGALLFASLMLFMGGRYIAAAAAAAYQERGEVLAHRVQPHLEAVLLILLAVSAGLLLLAPIRSLAGAPMLAAGAVAVSRLMRWRLWRCRRVDVWAAGIGYGWVAFGVMALGLALALGTGTRAVLHVITIGGLGTLSTAVMARQHYLRRHKARPPEALMLGAIVLMAVATLSRLVSATDLVPRTPALWGAAGAWSISWSWLFIKMLTAANDRRGGENDSR